MKCMRPNCNGTIIDGTCLLCGRPYVNGQQNPERISQRVRAANNLSTPLESYEPGITREQFFDFLKVVTKPIDKIEQGGQPPTRINHPAVIIAEVNTCLGNLTQKAQTSIVAEMKRAKKETTKPNTMSDPECLIVEKCDMENLRTLLDNWIETLKPYEQSDFAKGIACGLLAFDDYLAFLDKEMKEIFGDN